MNDYRLSAASKGMAQIGQGRPGLDLHAACSWTAAAAADALLDDRPASRMDLESSGASISTMIDADKVEQS